jgi:hypothetical protein
LRYATWRGDTLPLFHIDYFAARDNAILSYAIIITPLFSPTYSGADEHFIILPLSLLSILFY